VVGRTAQIVLASRSPRRAELLEQLQIAFRIAPVECNERPLPDESAEALVRRLAMTKAQFGQAAEAVLPVLGADTVVVVDGRVLGKPADADAAGAMLERLSGRDHEVLTAVAVCAGTAGGQRTEVSVSRSRVWFANVDPDQLARYRRTGEWRDKAGGYGIQGIGGILVRRIEGSHSGVMGLPIYETEALLRAFGVDTWRYRASG
jgi:septum formation protein